MSWTIEDWRRAPWLLSAKDVMHGTGCTKDDLRALRRAELLHRHLPGRQGKYFRKEVMLVFKIEEEIPRSERR